MYAGKRISNTISFSQIAVLAWFPLVLFYQELVFHLWAFSQAGTIIYLFLFSLALGCIFTFFCRLWSRRGARVAAGILTVACTLWFAVQTVYFTIFRTFLSLYSLGGAVAVLQFWREILQGIADSLLPLVLLLIPAVVYFIWGRRYVPLDQAKPKKLALLAGCAAVLQLCGVVSINLSGDGPLSSRTLYYREFVPELSMARFGAMTTLRLDMTQLVGLPRVWIEEPPVQEEPIPIVPDLPEEPDLPPEEEEAAPVVYAPNVMEIDFADLAEQESDKTLQALDAWFAQREPTMQHAATGRFAGKNLLWFTAEGFSRFAVDPELTPTLYRLANSGYVFENFYNPLWWVSTLDGEYAACTSLIPKPGVWSLYLSGRNEMYFCMGNQLRALGYDTRAYHNHTYTYYNRDVSHPNMGYEYQGVGNGLQIEKTWPSSDLEMMEVTLPQVVSDEPFHAYYMTVSGHMNYNFMGNAMAGKHKDDVAHLDMSETARAYLACQMELDAALEYTLAYLEETGHLEDTVICLSADHYPYGLDNAVLDELAGEDLDMRFDVFKSTLILWCGDMEEPVTVTKPCSSLDILPTLSNLFGVEYDSRLLMGRDILSDSEGLVVLSDRSFITDLGRYDAKKGAFLPNEGVEVPEGYVDAILTEVNALFANSKLVLEKDYYARLGLSHQNDS